MQIASVSTRTNTTPQHNFLVMCVTVPLSNRVSYGLSSSNRHTRTRPWYRKTNGDSSLHSNLCVHLSDTPIANVLSPTPHVSTRFRSEMNGCLNLQRIRTPSCEVNDITNCLSTDIQIQSVFNFISRYFSSVYALI